MISYLQEICWNCDRPIWVCKLKHLAKDVALCLVVGLTVGGTIGAILALIYNLFLSPFGRWS